MPEEIPDFAIHPIEIRAVRASTELDRPRKILTEKLMIVPDESDKDRMKYRILGSGHLREEDKLAQALGEVAWSYLAPHFRNGTLYFVDPELALEEVGLAFTGNQRHQVETWLKRGDLVKIEELHAAQWEGDEETRFEALVVSPFVLCRPI